jgi:hypothetical protein
MSNISLVKNVTNEQISDPDSFFLELGISGHLMNACPWVFLSIQKKETIDNSQLTPLLERVKEKFFLEVKQSETPTIQHLFSRSKIMNHKEKTVHLFGAAVLLSRLDSSLRLLIGCHSVFSDMLRSIQIPAIVEESSDDFVRWQNGSETFFINSDLKTGLQHAGINLPSDRMPNSELLNVYLSLKEQKSSQTGVSFRVS